MLQRLQEYASSMIYVAANSASSCARIFQKCVRAKMHLKLSARVSHVASHVDDVAVPWVSTVVHIKKLHIADQHDY